jgi:hypothetical protein
MERNIAMATTNRIALLASSALFCFGMLVSSATIAGEKPISLRYAGTGWDTQAGGVYPDNRPVSLTLGNAQGTFGNSTIAITAEFRDEATVVCPAGYNTKVAVVYSTAVLTFPDQSQLFGFAQTGWLCGNEATRHYFGEVSGAYVGGTGRFESATGDWVSKFEGAYLEPSLSFRSITGTITGTVDRH